jgi:phosphate/sulfate permease
VFPHTSQVYSILVSHLLSLFIKSKAKKAKQKKQNKTKKSKKSKTKKAKKTFSLILLFIFSPSPVKHFSFFVF